MTPFDIETARCRSAQRVWGSRTIADRLTHVRRLRHLLVEHTDRLTAIVHAELGRPADEVLATDVLPTAAAAQYLERHAARILASRRVSDRPLWLMGCRDRVDRVPRGIVGLIGTWNYPIVLNLVPMLHALVAGNGVVWKPSERMPQTAAAIASLVNLAAFPNDLVITLPATRENGPRLVESAIDHLHFTGSDTVGRTLAARLGERLIPSTLELSGCDAMFVLEDANVELAAKLARYGATLNQGCTCMAVRRVFVVAKHYNTFLAAFQHAGPTTNLELTLNPDAERNLPANRDARFSEHLVIHAVPNLDVALELWAESPLALTASIVTRNPNAAETLAKRLNVGAVIVNDVIVPTAHPATPFGGRGASGWGVSQGDEGLLEMTVPQVVTHRSGTFRPHADADPAAGDILRGVLRATHGDGLSERWQGVRQLIRGLRRSGRRVSGE